MSQTRSNKHRIVSLRATRKLIISQRKAEKEKREFEKIQETMRQQQQQAAADGQAAGNARSQSPGRGIVNVASMMQNNQQKIAQLQSFLPNRELTPAGKANK